MARWTALVIAIVVALGFATPREASADERRVVVLSGELSGTTKIGRHSTNLLRGTVRVSPGATLKIAAGATVFCDVSSSLIIEQGARIIADGTLERPIVFTSAQLESDRRRGDWGGLIVNGRAPVNAPGGVVDPVDFTGRYGGYEGAESSGVLRFVRIEYAGFPNGSDSRADALALRGVGSGTTIENVEALNGDGAGVRILGGEVNLRRIASVGNARAGLAAALGWTGRAQFVVAQQRTDSSLPGYAGLSIDHATPKIANATIVGGAYGVRLGAGARGTAANLVIAGCDREALAEADSSLVDDIARGNLRVDGVVVEQRGSGSTVSDSLMDALRSSSSRLLVADAKLANPYDEALPSFRPFDDSPLVDATNVAVIGGADPFFESTPYTGALGPAAESDWLAGWTSFQTPPSPRFLANAQRSSEDVANAFLDALATGDIVSMKRLRITKNEFAWYVWPELPASHLPNVTSDFAWSQATLNSLSGLASTLNSYSGRRFEFVSLRFAGGDEQHETYVVHYDTRLTLRNEQGSEFEVKLFGSMLESNGQYKLFSFVND